MCLYCDSYVSTIGLVVPHKNRRAFWLFILALDIKCQNRINLQSFHETDSSSGFNNLSLWRVYCQDQERSVDKVNYEWRVLPALRENVYKGTLIQAIS